MDSESDPRNLLFLFSFLPKAFTEIPLKHLTEEAFAVLECYFPVDFTPVNIDCSLNFIISLICSI